MASPTLLDIAKANGSDQVVGLIDETIRAHPEISGMVGDQQVANVGAARTIKGQNYKTLIRTGLATAGFRAANEGAVATKGTYDNRLVEVFILNPRWECDKAVADRYEDGAEAWITLEGSSLLEAGWRQVAKQFYYGRNTTFGGDLKGFPGLIDVVDPAMVVDAGGTTDNIASSVWAVKFGPKNVQWVYGENGAMELSDVRIADLNDSNTPPRRYTAYVQEILAYPGLQVGSLQAVGRIKKLTTDAGKGLTDALIGSLLTKFPVGIRPDVLFMSRRSLEQLRASRTATNATGAPAPTPADAFGVQIAPTDSIVDTETLAL
jgi:hypothetical protein